MTKEQLIKYLGNTNFYLCLNIEDAYGHNYLDTRGIITQENNKVFVNTSETKVVVVTDTEVIFYPLKDRKRSVQWWLLQDLELRDNHIIYTESVPF